MLDYISTADQRQALVCQTLKQRATWPLSVSRSAMAPNPSQHVIGSRQLASLPRLAPALPPAPRNTPSVKKLSRSAFTSGPALPCDSIQRYRPKPRAALIARAVAETLSPVTKYRSVSKGGPEPLGPSKQGSGVNFALFARDAKSVTLVLYDPATKANQEILLDPSAHRTGDVWHVLLEGLPGSGILYGYKVGGDGGWETGNRWNAKRVLLDPYAPLVSGRKRFAKREDFEQFKLNDGSMFWGTFDFDSAPFDWGNDGQRKRFELKDLVIYEMSVRCFTADQSSGVAESARGTYKGVIEKIPHLTSLGINAVELLPVFEYDELEFQRWKNPRDHMINVWGYSHLSFMAPMSRFGSAGTGPVAAANEFKEMVKALHAAGIEVLLDVVYNHTAEADDKEPYLLSFRGINNKVYYMVDPKQYVQLINYSGCGNTVNANHPVVRKLIIDSLVHYVEEYHVDGFRFDLASCLCRGEDGAPLPAPPLIREIANHPVLRQVKLIAEPWDLGMYQVGSFPAWEVWAEWNGMYRDDVRRFLKGDPGMKGALATRLAGSADLYNKMNRKPYHSVNFIVAHDGFSLHDLYAYNTKHNDANGEGNRDGTNDNLSWNCGAEGDTGDGGINALRFRMMRNAMVVLMMSQGTPMMVMGDELALTHYGNNNWYGHDNRLTWMKWERSPERDALLRFCSLLIKFRRSTPLLGRAEFLGKSDITWHESDWDNAESRFLAFTLHGKEGAASTYVALNAHNYQVSVTLPGAPNGQKWARVVDTNLPSPRDFTEGGNNGVEPVYGVAAHSCIVLISKSK